MCSEIECGVCYLRFNSGRRCPRELECRHVFCQSCLLLLTHSRQESEESTGQTTGFHIRCPLCRHSTPMSGVANVEDLRVLQIVLTEEDPDEEEDSEQEAAPEAEHSDSPVGTRGGRLRRSFRKVWLKISGKRAGETISNSEMRDLTLMACHMF